MHDIMHLLKIHAPPPRVFEAITTSADLRQWWTRDVAIEPTVGAVGRFGFNEQRFVVTLVVEEMTPFSRVRWNVTNSAWRADDIEFLLKPDGEETTLVLAHRGFPRADEHFASATTRWGFYLLSLKRYLQTGKGCPNPEDKEGLN